MKGNKFIRDQNLNFNELCFDTFENFCSFKDISFLKSLYDRFEKALERSMHIVKECPCKNEAGCPRCTFSYRCGNNNEFLHKYSALEILERINKGEKTVLIDPMEGDRPLV